MRPFWERLKSRKFIMALMAAIFAFIQGYYPDFPVEDAQLVVYALLGYVAIEGGVDAAAQLAKWLAQKYPEDKSDDGKQS